jgi:hypothetical protein
MPIALDEQGTFLSGLKNGQATFVAPSPDSDIGPKAAEPLFLLRQWPCHLVCAVDDELRGWVGGAILEGDNENRAQLNR